MSAENQRSQIEEVNNGHHGTMVIVKRDAIIHSFIHSFLSHSARSFVLRPAQPTYIKRHVRYHNNTMQPAIGRLRIHARVILHEHCRLLGILSRLARNGG